MEDQIKLVLTPTTVGMHTRYIPHSLNHRLHYMSRARWNKAWKHNVWGAVLESKHLLPKEPMDQVQITIVFRTCRLLDVDNSYTCVKPILDGLTEAGVIVDDSSKHVSLFVQQEQVHGLKKQGVDIYLKPTK